MLEQILQAGWWQIEFWGNTLKEYAISLAIFLGIIILIKIIQSVILVKVKKLTDHSKNNLDDVLVKIFASIKPLVYIFVGLWFGLKVLTLPFVIIGIIDSLLIILLTYQVIVILQTIVDFILEKETGNIKNKPSIKLLNNIFKGILWVLGVLLILSNLGINVTSLIAGLGIGGVAVALALQNILGDLFGSFVIHFDKPFQVGDFIVVDKEMGTVKRVGIKTTRIDSLQGEEIVISNKELTSSRVHNYGKMEARRVVFSFGLIYSTKLETLRKVPDLIKRAVDEVDKTRFDRAHFNKFGDSALNFEVVYFVLSGDYNEYMGINQQVLFNVKEKMEELKAEMAFPTQTIYLEK